MASPRFLLGQALRRKQGGGKGGVQARTVAMSLIASSTTTKPSSSVDCCEFEHSSSRTFERERSTVSSVCLGDSWIPLSKPSSDRSATKAWKTLLSPSRWFSSTYRSSHTSDLVQTTLSEFSPREFDTGRPRFSSGHHCHHREIRLTEELMKVDGKLKLTEALLESRNIEIKKINDEKKASIAAQFSAEGTLRRVHAAQKDDDMPPIEAILAPLEAEQKIACQEVLATSSTNGVAIAGSSTQYSTVMEEGEAEPILLELSQPQQQTERTYAKATELGLLRARRPLGVVEV